VSVQASLQSAQREIQPGSNLALRQFHQVAELDHFASTAGERAQRMVQQHCHVLAAERLDGIKDVWIGDAVEQCESGLFLVTLPERRARLKLPQVIARVAAADIAADFIQPEMKPLGRRETVMVRPGFQQRFLHHVFDAIGRNVPQVREALQAGTCRCQPPLHLARVRAQNTREIAGELRQLDSISSG
jgi:hypothetical protein